MPRVRQVLLDVAGTMLVKPDVPRVISEVLAEHGILVDPHTVAVAHARLSEVQLLPDVTTREFYLSFNADLARTLGADPSPALATAIYERCAGLQWIPDDGAAAVAEIGVPVGVVSNWDRGLEGRLRDHFPFVIAPVVVSSVVGVRKPDPRIFVAALEAAGCSASDVVYCGDSVRLDVEPAVGLGIRSVLLDRYGTFADHTGPRAQDLAGFATWIRNLD
jgi:FMN phosphatase YigB (HAD superfamily)